MTLALRCRSSHQEEAISSSARNKDASRHFLTGAATPPHEEGNVLGLELRCRLFNGDHFKIAGTSMDIDRNSVRISLEHEIERPIADREIFYPHVRQRFRQGRIPQINTRFRGMG